MDFKFFENANFFVKARVKVNIFIGCIWDCSFLEIFTLLDFLKLFYNDFKMSVFSTHAEYDLNFEHFKSTPNQNMLSVRIKNKMANMSLKM